ncbi:hypothetical protein [Streptomyces sirii]|uniref:hypothetical protein n=1 Tax=Streptomyces sirii TaxID=3127701 RepID=UPI003D3609F7
MRRPLRAVDAVRVDHRPEQDAREHGHRQGGVDRERMRPVPLEAAGGAGRFRTGVEGTHKRQR